MSPVGELTPEAVRAAGWKVLGDQLPYPLAIIKASALTHNSRWMNAFLDRFDVCLAPHRIGCSISHPCTTFDKWRVVLMVDDDYTVVEAQTTWF